MQETKIKYKALDILLTALFIFLALLFTYILYTYIGPDWDIMARYFNGYTLLNFLTTGVSPQYAFVGEFSNNLIYYFEPFREPLSTPIFALLSVFFQKPILQYLIVVLLGYAFAIYEFSKGVKADKLIAFAAFLNFYIISVSFENGGEMLSLIFVLLGVAYLLRKSPLSGLFIGLAGIAKYPSLILLPTVLLLGDRKKIAKAVALEAVPLLAWSLFDYALYGNPIYSYLQSIMDAGITSAATQVSASAIFTAMLFAILFAVIYLAYTYLKSGKRALLKELSPRGLLSSYNAKVYASIIALSAIGYAIIIPHNNIFTQARYGYLFSTCLLIPLVAVVGKKAASDTRLKYAVAACFIGALALSCYLAVILFNLPQIWYYNVNNSNDVYSQAGSALANLGFSSCKIETNAWIPMIYKGYDAYSPFVLYQSNTISPIVANLLTTQNNNYTNYETQVQRYPIIVFKYAGVSNSTILNINGSRLAYTAQNFSIYLPENAMCYRYQ